MGCKKCETLRPLSFLGKDVKCWGLAFTVGRGQMGVCCREGDGGGRRRRGASGTGNKWGATLSSVFKNLRGTSQYDDKSAGGPKIGKEFEDDILLRNLTKRRIGARGGEGSEE